MKRVLHHLLSIALFFILSQSLSAQTITTGFVAGHITTCQGAASANQEIQYFTVAGQGLTGNISASASRGFVISTSEYASFSPQLTLQQTRGGLLDTLYVRLQALPDTGLINGTITLSGAGASTRTIAVSGNILPTPVADTERNITVLNGATIPRLNFEGAHANTWLWTSSNPAIGLAATGIDSLPTFRPLISGNSPVTTTITVTPVWAGMAYMLDRTTNEVRIVNTVTDALDTSDATLGGYQFSECLSPDYKYLYVLNQANFTVIKTAINRVVNLLTLLEFVTGTAIAVSPNDSLLYILGGKALSTVDASTARLSQIMAVGASSMAVNPAGHSIYFTAGAISGTTGQATTFIAGYNVPATSGLPFTRIPSPTDAGDLLITPDTTNLVFTSHDTVFVTNQALPAIAHSFRPYLATVQPPTGIALSPDGKLLYVIVSGDGLRVFSMYDYSLVSYLPLADNFTGLCLNPDGTLLYITGTLSNVYVVNTTNNTLSATIQLPHTAYIYDNTVTPGGCYGNPITFTITVNPDVLPAFSETGSLTAMETTYGTPSASQSFTVSGTSTRAGILLAAPPGFELSLDNNVFSPMLTAGGAGTINSTTVYVRIAAATVVGTYSGHILLTSPGAANLTVAIPNSTVTPADLVIIADDKTKAFDAPDPALTLTFTGFKNNDGAAQLVYPPVVSTTATRTSPPGTYPITVGGAFSENYTISYVQGVLTITPNVIIPNTFTPNGDGVNDTWDIGKINDYPNCVVQVFSRYGQMVFQSTGYGVPWDGTYKGSPLPVGTYYYIINLNADVPLLSGFVAVIR